MTLSRCPSLGTHRAGQAAPGLLTGSHTVAFCSTQPSGPKTPGRAFLGMLPQAPGHAAGQGGELEDQAATEARDAPGALEQGEARAPTSPGGSGPPGGQRSQPVPPALAWPLRFLPAPYPPPSSKSGPWGQGLGSPVCPRVFTMCTHMGLVWATHAACVCLRSDACCVYTPATCTGRGVYTGVQATSSAVHVHACPGTSTVRITWTCACTQFCTQPSSVGVRPAHRTRGVRRGGSCARFTHGSLACKTVLCRHVRRAHTEHPLWCTVCMIRTCRASTYMASTRTTPYTEFTYPV